MVTGAGGAVGSAVDDRVRIRPDSGSRMNLPASRGRVPGIGPGRPAADARCPDPTSAGRTARTAHLASARTAHLASPLACRNPGVLYHEALQPILATLMYMQYTRRFINKDLAFLPMRLGGGCRVMLVVQPFGGSASQPILGLGGPLA